MTKNGFDLSSNGDLDNPYPTPCGDCGRTYLNGENMVMFVSQSKGMKQVWTGCATCWVKRKDIVREVGHEKSEEKRHLSEGKQDE